MQNRRRSITIIVIIVALAVLVGAGLYFASSKQTSLSNPDQQPGVVSSVSETSSDESAASEKADSPQSTATTGPPQDQLSITNLYVGKADCAVIEYAGSVGMIDAGTMESYDLINEFLRERGISKIDYLILTHYDKDHIGGSIPLLSDYNCESIYLADYVSQKQYYPELMAIVQQRDKVYFVNEPISLSQGMLSLEIIPADEPASLLEKPDNFDNNMSLVTMMTFGLRKFLFTGDIEKDRIAQMLSLHNDLTADWIKMPHHGDYQKKVAQLLEAVLPKYAVITTSSERPPDEKLITLLKEDNILTYDTMSSNVYTLCDGREISVTRGEP